MGSEYATGVGSSFVSRGQEPKQSGVGGYGLDGGGMNGGAIGGGRTRHKRSNTQSGMAKAAVNGVREWAGETGELLGLWKGERARPL